jgi:hypothetical protein
MPKYKKGQSGNPTGRRRGSLNKRTQLANILDSHAEDLVQKAIEMALDGDSHALKLCIERLIPKVTSQPIHFDLGKVDGKKPDNLSLIGLDILMAISFGELRLDDAQKLFGILDKQRHLIEFTDLVSKIQEIEELVKN